MTDADGYEYIMDKDVEIMFLVSKGKTVSRNNLNVNLSTQFNRQSLPAPHEQDIENVWQLKLKENPKIWNGTKFRIHSVKETGNGTVTFNLGITDYKEFIGTNWAPNANELQKYGLKDFDNKHAYMSDALGVGSLVVTSDDRIILLRRSQHCAEAVGLLDIPGGHPEPKMLVGNLTALEIDLSKLNPSDVVDEIFNSTLSEICDEVNIPKDSLSDPVLMGIARNTTSAGRPSSEYYVRCNLTSKEVENLYKQGVQQEAEESVTIMTIPEKDILNLQETQQHIWNEMAPSAKGCFTLYKLINNAHH